MQTDFFLKSKGLNSSFCGNPILETIKEEKIPAKKKRANVLILPGSRDDVFTNIQYILKILDKIGELGREKSFNFFMHLSASIDVRDLKKILSEKWTFSLLNFRYLKAILKNRSITVYLFKNIFKDILAVSKIVIGLSGTANEQSVGAGKPVFAFSIPNTHATHYRFTKRQKPLLGENLVYFSHFDPYRIAKTIIDIAFNATLLKRFNVKGKEKFGKKDLSFISEDIWKELQKIKKL